MRVVDLSLPLDATMPGFEASVAKRLDVDGWNASTLRLYSHCGTHMDAPRHFLPDGGTLESIDLTVCVGTAKIVTLAPISPRHRITVADLGAAIDHVQPGDRLLLRTDWYLRFGTPAYRNELPRISMELASWLVEKQISLIGVEPPSVADVNDSIELTSIHQTLFRGGVTIVEGLAHLDQIRSLTVEFIALPLNIQGGDGCPVRAIAIEHD